MFTICLLAFACGVKDPVIIDIVRIVLSYFGF